MRIHNAGYKKGRLFVFHILRRTEAVYFYTQPELQISHTQMALPLRHRHCLTASICWYTHSQCCGSGSGIRCLFDPWIQDPDLGSQTHISKFYNSLKIRPNFFFFGISKIIYNFVKFVATKKVWQQIYFTTFFCSCFGIRDLRTEIREG